MYCAQLSALNPELADREISHKMHKRRRRNGHEKHEEHKNRGFVLCFLRFLWPTVWSQLTHSQLAQAHLRTGDRSDRRRRIFRRQFIEMQMQDATYFLDGGRVVQAGMEAVH